VDGLTLMPRGELTAVIPVDARVAADRVPPWQMPGRALYARLLEVTGGRVLRSDTGWPNPEDLPPAARAADWAAERAKADVTLTDLYIDVRIR
jgi:hypothetical protein